MQSQHNHTPSRTWLRLLLFAAASLGFWQWGLQSTRAATWTICQSGGCDFSTIQAAINASSSGDTLAFAPENSANEIYIETVILNKSLTLVGQNTTIDAQNSGTAVSISGNPTVVLQDMNIRNGSLNGNGAGIRLNGGNLTLTNVSLTGHTATGSGSGGALYIASGSSAVLLQDVTIANNTAVSGGGIYSNGILTANALSLTDNVAANGAGLYNNGQSTLAEKSALQRNGDATTQSGGGVFNAGSASLTFLDGDIANNDAINGAGIFNDGTLLLNNVNLGSSNVAVQAGGGLYNSGEATLNNSAVVQNDADSGAGVYNEGMVTATNSTLSRNDGPTGAGFYNVSGSASLNNVTIHLTIGTSLFAGGGTVSIGNSIISSASGQTACGGGGTYVSNGYNLANDDSCTFLTSVGDLQGVDPLLHGITSPEDGAVYHSPKLTSPVMDAGNPAAPGSGSSACPATDQRGVTRPQSEYCDIGAVELLILRAYVPLVTK